MRAFLVTTNTNIKEKYLTMSNITANEQRTLSVSNPKCLDRDNVPDSIMFRNLNVTRQHCIDLSLLTSYFRFLRHYSDDTLQSNLNDSKTPDTKSKLKRCDSYTQELFENWGIRKNIITFCDQEADDLKRELDSTYEHDNKKIITEAKIDSYALKDLQNEKNKYYYNYNVIKQWVSQQQGVETILQDRAGDVLRRDCDQNMNYKQAFDFFYKSLNK